MRCNYSMKWDGDPENNVGRYGAAAIVFIICAGVLGNILVIVTVATVAKLRRSYNVFIASLAANDLLFNVAIMPFYVDTYVYRRWRFTTALCRFETFAGTVLVISSSFHIAAIAMNRYVLIAHKDKYSKYYNRFAISFQIAAIWLTSFLIVLPGIIGWEALVEYSDQTGRCSYVRSASKGSLGLVFGLGFIVPCAAIIVCYISISIVVWRSKQKLAKYKDVEMEAGRPRCNTMPEMENLKKDIHENNGRLVTPPSIGSSTELSDQLGLLKDRHQSLDTTRPLSRRPQRHTIPSPNRLAAPKHGSHCKASLMRRLHRRRNDKRHFKSFKMILAVFLGFSLSYLPFTMLNFADGSSCLDRVWYMTTSLLFWAGSCINPWIYGAMNTQFREAYHKIICACVHKGL